MATNQGLLQAQIKVKNTIDLNNAFSSPSVANPQLKSIEGDLNLSNEYALQSFNSSNTNTQHIDTIRTNSSNTSLKEALNNLPNLQYIRLEGSYESKGNSFDNNTNLQKVNLSESLQVRPEDFKANENLKTLPKLDYSNPDLTDIITNDTNLKPTTFDISNKPNTNKLGIHGDSTHQLGNLEFVKVNPDAPFDNQITPQIDTSYTSLNRNGLVNLFNTMPYNVGYTVVGSPTIVDGIASGFSSGNYVNVNSWKDEGQDLEIVISFILPSEFPTYANPINRWTGGSSNQTSLFYVNSYKSGIGFRLTSSESITLSYSLQTETEYSLKLTRSNGVYTLYLLDSSESVLGSDTLTSATLITGGFSGQLQLGYDGSVFGTAFAGSIDLNKTYIKVNSKVSTGPVGYTVVGSPTIVDGVASGFSTSDYLKLYNMPYNSFVGRIRAKVDSNASGYIGLLNIQGNSPVRRFTIEPYNLNSVRYYHYDTTSSANIPSSFYIGSLANKWIDYDFSYSLDTKSLTVTITDVSTGTLQNTQVFENFDLGGNADEIWIGNIWSAFQGSIDLNHTYIKVNGKLWFGHESKQVTWFNGKPSQIKVVDISGAAGTSSLTNDDKAIVTNKGWRLVTDGSNSKNYTIEDGKLVAVNPNIYLQSLDHPYSYTGFAYIDTGFIPTNKTTFEFVYSQLQAPTGYEYANTSIFMINAVTRNGVSYNPFGFNFQSGEFRYFDPTWKNISPSGYGVKTLYTSNITNSNYVVANKTSSANTNFDLVSNQQAFGNLYLGCWHYGYDDGTSVPYYPMYGNLYYAKFWEDGVLIRYFVPVPAGLVIGSYTVPSNGMFDIVNQQFYANQGTGQFTYGWDL